LVLHALSYLGTGEASEQGEENFPLSGRERPAGLAADEVDMAAHYRTYVVTIAKGA